MDFVLLTASDQSRRFPAAMGGHPSNNAHTVKKLEFADSWHLG